MLKIREIRVPALIILTISLAWLSSCGKTNDEGGSNGEPPPTFQMSFIIVDSLGNNLLPYDLPDNPVVDPMTFTAYSDYNSDIGSYTRHPQYGYIFRMSELIYNVQQDFNWEMDSTFSFYSCFGVNCDTVVIKKKILTYSYQDTIGVDCYADRIIFQSETIDNYFCSIIPIHNF